ncbi:cytochrome b2 [Xylariales sp. PMI_506]|nr:cytochrome b2 [Xylariales sp. PMI_506]
MPEFAHGLSEVKAPLPELNVVSLAELRRHNKKDDCWVVVHKKVWDVTDFLDEHPGGPQIILSCAGDHATEQFDKVHAPGMFEDNLPAEKFKGLLEQTASEEASLSPAASVQQSDIDAQPLVVSGPPALQTLISAADFEKVAEVELTEKTWAFYSSAATDLITHRQNKEFLRRVMIQPRILRNVRRVNFKRRILGFDCEAPFFISPAAMAKLVHPDGEIALAKAAAAEGIIQCISNNASYPLASIVQSVPPQQPFFLQLYVNAERHKTTELLLKAKSLGIRAIFVTVDAPVPGKREADERIAAGHIQSAISGAASTNDKKGGGLGRLMAQYIDKSLTWDDLAWIKETSSVPIILKGVQNVEDAKMAVRYGVDGIFLSNHGGRSLDTSQPAILNLLELRLKYPEAFSHLEVFVDGGFERGTDILKALALGATAVGIGRPYLYSLIYGQDGAQHLTQILKDEIETSMRLCGITSLDQATPDLLNTAAIDTLVRSTVFPEIPQRLARQKGSISRSSSR